MISIKTSVGVRISPGHPDPPYPLNQVLGYPHHTPPVPPPAVTEPVPLRTDPPPPYESEEEEEAGVDEEEENDDDASSVSSTSKSPKPKQPPTPEQLALAEQLEKLFIDVTQKDRVAVLEIVKELVVKKMCACGKRLAGKYIELGTCADCSPKKQAVKGKELKCAVCDSKLYTKFRELGLCSSCHKKKEKREEKAAKEGANKK